MKPEQIIKALDRYIQLLETDHGPLRFSAELADPNSEECGRHAHWMALEAKTFAEADPDKAMRWLCFIQGALWRDGKFTIAEFKDDNRGEG